MQGSSLNRIREPIRKRRQRRDSPVRHPFLLLIFAIACGKGRSANRLGIRLLFALAVTGLGLLISGCAQQNSAGTSLELPNPPAPGSTLPASVESQLAGFPPVPKVLPKPIVLGKAYPGVIVLPPHISEPWIRVKITPEENTPPQVNAALYAGRVYDIRLPDGNYVAINSLPIEQYLTGVLSKELYANWSMAAYRAQAVAARTYALYQIETFGRTHPWDVTGTQSSQVYGGRNAETPHSRLATQETRGIVMEGEAHGQWGIFCAYFSACNGGAEESAHAAWGDHRVSTLVNKYTGNLDAACPEFNWPTMAIPMWAITNAVHWWGVKNKVPYLADLGPITDIAITRSNPITGRPEIITLTDAAGHIGKMRAEVFRLALLMDPNPQIHAPPSSFFRMVRRPNEILLVDGHGFGHGVGLSQWGAEKLATEGYSARYILQMYYPGNILHREW